MGCGSSNTSGSQPAKKQPARTKGKGGGKAVAEEDDKVQTQPVNEKGYKRRIREYLRKATAGNDLEELEKYMEMFVSNHMVDGGDYTNAEKQLEFLLLKKDIRDACMRRHPVVLDKAIQRVEASKYRDRLKQYLERAKRLRDNQNEPATFRHDISDMDQCTISEIRSYHHPPPGVHETMISVYLILGYPENHLIKDWTEITALMGRIGKDSLIREVTYANPNDVDNNTGVRAKKYLGQYSLEEVRSVSNGAAAFHVWASDMLGTGKGADKEGNETPNKQPSGKGQSKSGNQSKTPGQSAKSDKNTSKQQTPSKQEQQKQQQQPNKQQSQQQKQQQQQQQGKGVKDNTKQTPKQSTPNNTNSNKSMTKKG